MSQDTNKLFFGDNLNILRDNISDNSVDLIYLDPPFNSNASYNVLFREKSGEDSAAQITAFDDTWQWGIESEYAYHDVVTEGPKLLSDLMQALRSFLGRNDMMAYLIMMAQRMAELHRVLKPSGSIYLHCDPKASHYLKLVMDAVFGPKMFKNEIIWKRTSGHSDAKRYGNSHDVILYYTYRNRAVWNQSYQPYEEDYVEEYYSYKDPDGRKWMSGDLTAAGLQGGGYVYEWNGVTREWRLPPESMKRLDSEGRVYYTKNGIARRKRYLDESEGMKVQDIWTDIQALRSWHAERLGYPTQKPEALLERIIKASSNEGDIVLDPFCGCGTAIAAAENLNRKWIGIDITHIAITLIRHRLRDSFGDRLRDYTVIGTPVDLHSAIALAEQDRHQFEWWSLGLVNARPANDKRKGADSGVDGYINFFDDNSGKAKKIIVQVKSGHVQRGHVAMLKGDMEREKAEIGLFITLEPPTTPMTTEAAATGFYEPEHFPGRLYPRIQILTIEELFAGATAEYPKVAPDATFQKAPRQKDRREQKKLLE